MDDSSAHDPLQDGPTPTNTDELEAQLQTALKERQEYLEGWQRLKADVANIKRLEGERLMNARTEGSIEALEALLPALDSFEMARRGDAWQKIDPAWKSGMDMVYNQLENALLQIGATKIGQVGEPFDPHVHEPVANAPVTPETPENTVAQVHQYGWKLGDRLVRPARVSVAQEN